MLGNTRPGWRGFLLLMRLSTRHSPPNPNQSRAFPQTRVSMKILGFHARGSMPEPIA